MRLFISSITCPAQTPAGLDDNMLFHLEPRQPGSMEDGLLILPQVTPNLDSQTNVSLKDVVMGCVSLVIGHKHHLIFPIPLF